MTPIAPADGTASSGPGAWFRHRGDLVAAFATTDHLQGARLGSRIAELDPDAHVDVRERTVRVRVLGGSEPLQRTEAIDALAREAGAPSSPQSVRLLSVVLETVAPGAAASFWQAVLGYRREQDALVDPLGRRPALILRPVSGAPAPRGRLHLDSTRPDGPEADGAPALGGAFPGGPYGVRAADPEGTIADLLPWGPSAEDPAVSAWHGGFSAQAAWHAPSVPAAAAFAESIAELADRASCPLSIDRRRALVVADSGKDVWETHPGFADLAAAVQAQAHSAGLTEDGTGLGVVQAFLSADSAERIRGFWAAALGYEEDSRDGVLDLVDPLRLGPVLGFQDVDEPLAPLAGDPFHLLLDAPPTVLDKILEAPGLQGAAVREAGPGVRILEDPEGNQLELRRLAPVSSDEAALG